MSPRLFAPFLLGLLAPIAQAQVLRPPATPLAVQEPAFSIWMPAERPYDADSVDVEGNRRALTCLVRIDGRVHRILGTTPSTVPPFVQKGRMFGPTHSDWTLADEHLGLALQFSSPTLPGELDALSRPVAYVGIAVRVFDQAPHKIEVQFDAEAAIACASPSEAVVCGRGAVPGVVALHASGSRGRLWLAAKDAEVVGSFCGSASKARAAFVAGEPLASDDALTARPANSEAPALVLRLAFGAGGTDLVRHALWLGFESSQRLSLGAAELRPWWRRDGVDGAGLMALAARDAGALEGRARGFDSSLQSDLVPLGGSEWTKLSALAFRQAFGSAVLAADSSGAPVLLPMQGSRFARTVDVVDGAPVLVATSPGLARALLAPLLEFARSSAWNAPFAPLELEEPAPTSALALDPERVEATAGVILLVAELAAVEENTRFAERYSGVLARWADSLDRTGFEFAAPSAESGARGFVERDANAACAQVLALGAWSQLAAKRGQEADSKRFRARAEELARTWLARTSRSGGAPTRQALDAEGNWSVKSALVWDRLLGLALFPTELGSEEFAAVRARMDSFGVPNDGRSTTADLARYAWIAALARDRAEFEAFLKPLHRWAGATTDLRPLAASFDAHTGRARSASAGLGVGALFLRMMQDRVTQRRWSSQGARVGDSWAPYVPRASAGK